MAAYYPTHCLQFGDDEFGHMLVNILKQNNVNSEGCLFDQHARTALAFVTLKKNGEREFMFYRNPSADMLLTEAELNLDLIRRAKIFHYGSISLIADPVRSAHLAAMRAAKAAGILCSYDPNVRLPLWPSEDAAREGILSIWKEADFIKVSDDEVAFLTKGDANDEKNVLSLWFDGLKLLIVTDGEKGCRYFTKDFKGSVPGFKVDTIDTTGAGDAFVGSLLVNVAKDDSIFHVRKEAFFTYTCRICCFDLKYVLLINHSIALPFFQNEEKLREALRFSNACGAICTTKKGAIPALPTVATAQELIAKAN